MTFRTLLVGLLIVAASAGLRYLVLRWWTR